MQPSLTDQWSGPRTTASLLPNGAYLGTGRIAQIQQFTGDLYLAGQWLYDMMNNVLTLQGTVNAFLPFAATVAFQGQRGGAYVAVDPEGEAWTFRRG
jgi:hypothetical protein